MGFYEFYFFIYYNGRSDINLKEKSKRVDGVDKEIFELKFGIGGCMYCFF